MTKDLPISNFIRVSLTGVPEGISERNVNSLALFTTEVPAGVDPYIIALNSRQVEEEYGTDSVTKQMADRVFAQTPNILSGGGRLVVVPMLSAVSATKGKFDTADITANLSNLQAVTDGAFDLTLNGTSIGDISGIDLSNASDLDDVATIIQRKLTDVKVTNTSGVFTFESKKFGTSSAVVLATPAGGTDLTVASLLNIAGGSGTAGTNASGETLVEAIARVKDLVDFVPLETNLEMEDTVVDATADSIQAQDRIWVHHFSSTEDLETGVGICSLIEQAGNNKTRCVFYSLDTDEANLMKSAYAGRGFSTNFTGSNTTQTMNLKQLTSVLPDSISQTTRDQALAVGVDTYASYGGRASITSSGENAYFDEVYNDAWLKTALETAGFNALAQTNTKIPQTEPGMNKLKDAYKQVLKQAVRNLAVAPGSWNSTETFGDPEDFKRNVLENGYYVYSLPIVQQSQVDREARIAPLVQIAVKRAGAFHSSDVIVVIER